ncbi:MAG: transcriptional regulator [Mycoplasma sp.]|nr:transcriptional regulator [Mycoplasma sp.]
MYERNIKVRKNKFRNMTGITAGLLEFMKGSSLLVMILIVFTFFSYYMPKGKKAMSGLSGAVCATFLIEVFNFWVLGNIPGLGDFTKKIGVLAGVMAAPACAILVIILMGGKPINAVLSGATIFAIGFAAQQGDGKENVFVHLFKEFPKESSSFVEKLRLNSHYSILAGLVAGYVMYFLYNLVDKYLVEGLDLIIALLIGVPLTAIIATGANASIAPMLGELGTTLEKAQNMAPIPMSIIIGGFLTVVGTSPLSSMALAVAIQLQGAAMAIGSITAFGSIFMNGTLFWKMKYGGKKEIISVSLEPLSQADVISMNPISVYVTNFIGAAVSGVVVTIIGVYILNIEQKVEFVGGVKDTVEGFAQQGVGLATPFGPVAMFGQGGANKGYEASLGITLAIVAVINVGAGLLGGYLFRNSPRVTIYEINGVEMPYAHQLLKKEINFYQKNKRRLPIYWIIKLNIEKVQYSIKKHIVNLIFYTKTMVYKLMCNLKLIKAETLKTKIVTLTDENKVLLNDIEEEVKIINNKLINLKQAVEARKQKLNAIKEDKKIDEKVLLIKNELKSKLLEIDKKYKKNSDLEQKHKHKIERWTIIFDYQEKIDAIKPLRRINLK